MNRLKDFLKKNIMLVVSLAAAIASLFITPPDAGLLENIDWKTLATLFMLLSVLDGFKKENLFLPVIRMASRMKSLRALGFFLVYSVFISSMFVTNDVSLIIFVPLTIILFRAAGREDYIIPLLVMENIAAVRGSLLTPFGSPQNLFLFSESGMDAGSFMLMMLPLWVGSAILIAIFILVIFRKDSHGRLELDRSLTDGTWEPESRGKRILYVSLFCIIVATVVSRTSWWPYVTAGVTLALLVFDPKVFRRVDYVLLLTFLCFFVFSSSIAGNGRISAFLTKSVAGNEYWWSLGLSQIISNVPASIVLWPFTADIKPLIYGLDTAGLVSVIGSLASVINMRIYTREYPGSGMKFMAAFEKICLIFFAIVLVPQLLLC